MWRSFNAMWEAGMAHSTAGHEMICTVSPKEGILTSLGFFVPLR